MNGKLRFVNVKRGRRLEYFTIGWNLLEAFVSVAAGLIAGSIALIGFGIDSLIETASGTILLWRLWEGETGIIIAALSLAVMPFLARAKRKVALEISSRALVADSKQTDICAYLSAILLGGLGLNVSLGWWWADPLAGLIMVPVIVKEGLESLRGDTCSDCHR